MNKIMRVFLDTDFRCGHEGLALIAKSHKVDTKKLEPGEHLIFINRRSDRMKVYSSRNVVSYLLGNGRLDLSTLSYFSECYGAKGFQYDEAIKKVLLKRLKNKQMN